MTWHSLSKAEGELGYTTRGLTHPQSHLPLKLVLHSSRIPPADLRVLVARSCCPSHSLRPSMT